MSIARRFFYIPLLILAGRGIFAIEYTWTGGSAIDFAEWSTARNWNPLGPPDDGDTAIFRAGTFTLGQDLTIKATLQIEAGATFNTGSNELRVNSAVKNAGTFNAENSTLTVVGDFSNTGTLTAQAAAIILGANFDCIGTFTAGSSTVRFTGANGHVIYGDIEFYSLTADGSAGSSLQLQNDSIHIVGQTANFGCAVSGNASLRIQGNAAFGGKVNIKTLTVRGASTVNAASITTSGMQSYEGAVTIGSDTTLTTTEGNIICREAIALSGKTLILDAAGTVELHSASGVGSIVLKKMSSLSVSDAAASLRDADLRIETPDSIPIALATNLLCKNISLASGTFNAGASIITVSGGWNNAGGNFGAGSSTVIFTDNADHAIYGSTTFHNLTMDASSAAATRRLTFAGGATQSVTGALTLKGKAGQVLELGGPSAWTIDMQGTSDISCVSATYANAKTKDIVARNSNELEYNNKAHTDALWLFPKPPEICFTSAKVGGKKIYVQLSAFVKNATLLSFNLPPGLSLTSVESIVKDINGYTKEFFLNTDRDIKINDLLTGEISLSPMLTDEYGSYAAATPHPIADIVIGLITVAAASDGIHASSETGSLGLLRSFDGTGRLYPRGATIFTVPQSTLSVYSYELHYDTDVPLDSQLSIIITGKNEKLKPFWLPDHVIGLTQSAKPKSEAERIIGTHNFTIPLSEKIKPGADLSFLFKITAGPRMLYAARDASQDIDDPRQFDAWRYSIADTKTQRGGVSILNNVINSATREKTVLRLQGAGEGIYTVLVFTLDGNVVKTLHSGKLTAGDHEFSWDGTNASGSSVARGMYFIRVVGPGTDEIRKVMVVKD